MTPRFQPLLALLITSGACWGEATALQVRDLDVAASVIHVRRAWKKGAQGVALGVSKTQRGRRAIMLPDHVVAMLTPLAAGRPPEDFLLASPPAASSTARTSSSATGSPHSRPQASRRTSHRTQRGTHSPRGR